MLYTLAVLTTNHREAALSAGVWFWILYVICFLFSGWTYWPYGQPGAYRPFGGILAIYILIFLLGWVAVGPPIR